MFLNNNLLEIYHKYHEGRLAHAYLLETNNIPKLIDDLKELIKAINCPLEYQDNCRKCNLCNLITKNNLPSLIIIEPDGTSIKKTQIESLKISFETKPFITCGLKSSRAISFGIPHSYILSDGPTTITERPE